MSTRYGNFLLMNLETDSTFVFDLFPERVNQAMRANWEPQDVYRGVKPLAYGNREPQRIRVECWLDRSDAGESISPDIDALFALQAEGVKGQPPALLALWGDRFERVVLEEVEVETERFLPLGEPVRARVRLGLTGLQDDLTQTSVREVDDDAGAVSVNDPAVTTGQATGTVRVGPIP
jgi:hypothetical protein